MAGEFTELVRRRASEGVASPASRAMPSYKPAAGGDPEIKSMNTEAPLLDLIRSDTGEAGSASGDRIDFVKCPICGHRDCFSFYPSSNTWACFSDHNTTGYKGGTFVEYQVSAHGLSVKQAVSSLREATGHPRKAKAEGVAPVNDMPADALRLPSWESVRAVDPPKRPPALIEGILRRGHTMLLAGKAKSGKSWAGIALSVAVATGGEWMGRKCGQGAVIYIDPELDPRSLDNRFARVAEAMGADPSAIDAKVLKWCIRGLVLKNGNPPTIADISHDICLRKPEGVALIVIDSASCFVEGDENASRDVRSLFGYVNSIAQATGAAVAVIHHFGKGAAGDRDAIDRARGSSVWGDAPDVVLILTEVFPPSGEAADYLPERSRAFVLDSTLREYPEAEPMRLIYEYPLHRIDTEGITAEWKPKSGAQTGGRKAGESQAAKAEVRSMKCELALMQAFYKEGIGAEGMEATKAAEVCAEFLGEAIKPATVKGYVESSEVFDVWQKSPRRWLVVPLSLPKQPEAQPEQATLGV